MFDILRAIVERKGPTQRRRKWQKCLDSCSGDVHGTAAPKLAKPGETGLSLMENEDSTAAFSVAEGIRFPVAGVATSCDILRPLRDGDALWNLRLMMSATTITSAHALPKMP